MGVFPREVVAKPKASPYHRMQGVEAADQGPIDDCQKVVRAERIALLSGDEDNKDWAYGHDHPVGREGAEA